jgi:hypothetical protein
MCVTCGCGELHNNHGDPRHLTIEVLERAAEAAGISLQQAAENLEKSARQYEAGYPEAVIQCSKCGQQVRQADMVSHSASCTGQTISSHGGTP